MFYSFFLSYAMFLLACLPKCSIKKTLTLKSKSFSFSMINYTVYITLFKPYFRINKFKQFI